MSATRMKWASWLLRALLLLMIVQSAVGARWGPFTSAECVGNNQRKYYAQLYDIQGDPDTACQNTPATVREQHFSRPSNCVNKGIGGEWGEFDISDASCNGRLPGRFHRRSL